MQWFKTSMCVLTISSFFTKAYNGWKKRPQETSPLQQQILREKQMWPDFGKPTIYTQVKYCTVDVQARTAIAKCNRQPNRLNWTVKQYSHQLEFVQSIYGCMAILRHNSLIEQSWKIAYTSVHQLYGTEKAARQFRRVSGTLLMSIQICTVDVQAHTAIAKCNQIELDRETIFTSARVSTVYLRTSGHIAP